METVIIATIVIVVVIVLLIIVISFFLGHLMFTGGWFGNADYDHEALENGENHEKEC